MTNTQLPAIGTACYIYGVMPAEVIDYNDPNEFGCDVRIRCELGVMNVKPSELRYA